MQFTFETQSIIRFSYTRLPKTLISDSTVLASHSFHMICDLLTGLFNCDEPGENR